MAKVDALITKAKEITKELSDCMTNSDLDDTDKLSSFIYNKTEKLEEVIDEIESEVESLQEDISELEDQKKDLEEKAESEEEDASEYRNELEEIKDIIGPINADNMHDEMKVQVIKRLFKNLRLEQIEQIETLVKTSFKEKQQHYIQDVF